MPTLNFSTTAVRLAVRGLTTGCGRSARRSLKAITLPVFVAMAIAEPAKGQLMYDYTSFLHGFASGPSIWSTHYPDLLNTSPGYLSGQVNLRTVLAPNLDSLARYDGQVSNLAAVLNAGGRHVLPAHSLGTLVARGTYIDVADTRPNVAGIIAIAALHQGAPLADNFISLRNFLGDLQRRLEGGQAAIRAEAPIVLFVTMAIGAFQGFGFALMSWIIDAASGEIVDLSSFRAFGSYDALVDLSPNSTAVLNLRSNTGDAAIPRANIYGTIPHKHAALRLLQSAKNQDAGFPALVERRNQAMTAFKVCRAVGYATIVYWGAGRHCGFARRVLGRLDERWVLYVNGKNPNGSVRTVPFDGVVPNERSVYPTVNGLTYEAQVVGVNHLNIYKTRLGLNQVGAAMLAIGMEPPGSLDVTGPTVIESEVEQTYNWTALADGAGPWSYQWEISINGGSFSIASSTNSYSRTIFPGDDYSFTLRVTATRSSGSRTRELPVTVVPPAPGGCEPIPPAVLC